MSLTERLLIMRHGDAAFGAVDHERELTQRGQQEVRGMGGWLAAQLEASAAGLAARPRLLASPYRRAQQTAALVADVLVHAGIPVDVETLELITPEGCPSEVVDWLLNQPAQQPLVMVSHMPLVGALTGCLVDGRADGGLGFVTAAVADLEADVWASGAARLRHMMTPREREACRDV
ncbi:phosphohistidine phosphatase SixA [Halomonas halocynthiae]|uniref:phosphohistidine phosphatase SixA n=1 Tax=Halomonas halocynthiae TaxID=176290 RepID=UPI00041F010D|nr:phosphohistidine phosphatase SixA [Halomonas halocynthiae]